MSIYQKAARLKLRFNTPYGVLSTENLFDLSLQKLSGLIKEQNKVNSDLAGNSDELSFLSEATKVDERELLRFEILKDVYITKKDEMNSIRKEAETKEHNEKIMALIHEKQEGALKEKSIEELQALLKK